MEEILIKKNLTYILAGIKVKFDIFYFFLKEVKFDIFMELKTYLPFIH